MTNKEAIAILENLKIQGKTFFSQRLALDLAIKALEEADNTSFKEVVAYECGQKSEERPQGEWMKSDIPESLLAKCSICGFDCGAYTHNFCPNCGAKMQKGEG